jgi:hypothetical protein
MVDESRRTVPLANVPAHGQCSWRQATTPWTEAAKATYEQCMLRMLRAGAYAPDDEHDYEDGEKAQLLAAAEQELNDEIMRTAALLQRVLHNNTGTQSATFSNAAGATPPPDHPRSLWSSVLQEPTSFVVLAVRRQKLWQAGPKARLVAVLVHCSAICLTQSADVPENVCIDVLQTTSIFFALHHLLTRLRFR